MQKNGSALALQVERHASLVAIKEVKHGCHGPGHLADLIAAVDGFHLDHIRAHVREDLARGRPGDDMPELEHLHSRQRQPSTICHACRLGHRQGAAQATP